MATMATKSSMVSMASTGQQPQAQSQTPLLAVSLTLLLTLLLVKFLATHLLRHLDPLHPIPGPKWAKFSNLWYLHQIRNGNFHRENMALHERYGPIVRYGPSRVSIADLESVRMVYILSGNNSKNGGENSGGSLNKSTWYQGWNKPGIRSIFTERDHRTHAQMRRKFASVYSMTSMTSYEGFVDECITLLRLRFDEMTTPPTPTHPTKQTLDFAWWMECFAADTVSMVTYSKRMGFLDAGEDIEALMSFLHGNLRRSAQLGVFAWMTPLAVQVLGVWSALKGERNPMAFVRDFAVRAIRERREMRALKRVDGRNKHGEDECDTPRDFLDKFLDFHERDPEKFDQMDITIGLSANLVAGADTTAASLAAIFYHLHRNPNTLTTLRAEIEASFPNTDTHITFKEAQGLPYLQAVIREALRMHPATGLCLERDVPKSGLELNGHFLPAGTIFGANSWVLHYSKAIFGEDADVFKPERWLETDVERLKEMNRAWMPFGLGSRTCIGQHVSMLEMTKMVPEVIRRFEFELVDGVEKEWEVANYWFVIPKALPMKISKRKVEGLT
ncbi:Hypothetical protein R9X50_00065500 [Acrodontium crateriforme]|uniref:Pisatin demethylase n=1 Tax=Acrodontium crateriforme TaxID=150365 RepID=A0AAQ3LXQ0_9PEZI|nr:Hypothetical protein R9X50_00065500 [Acrodontium crateriforme]